MSYFSQNYFRASYFRTLSRAVSVVAEVFSGGIPRKRSWVSVSVRGARYRTVEDELVQFLERKVDEVIESLVIESARSGKLSRPNLKKPQIAVKTDDIAVKRLINDANASILKRLVLEYDKLLENYLDELEFEEMACLVVA